MMMINMLDRKDIRSNENKRERERDEENRDR